jgi:hypothetical protein
VDLGIRRRVAVGSRHQRPDLGPAASGHEVHKAAHSSSASGAPVPFPPPRQRLHFVPRMHRPDRELNLVLLTPACSKCIPIWVICWKPLQCVTVLHGDLFWV